MNADSGTQEKPIDPANRSPEMTELQMAVRAAHRLESLTARLAYATLDTGEEVATIAVPHQKPIPEPSSDRAGKHLNRDAVEAKDVFGGE